MSTSVDLRVFKRDVAYVVLDHAGDVGLYEVIVVVVVDRAHGHLIDDVLFSFNQHLFALGLIELEQRVVDHLVEGGIIPTVLVAVGTGGEHGQVGAGIEVVAGEAVQIYLEVAGIEAHPRTPWTRR